MADFWCCLLACFLADRETDKVREARQAARTLCYSSSSTLLSPGNQPTDKFLCIHSLPHDCARCHARFPGSSFPLLSLCARATATQECDVACGVEVIEEETTYFYSLLLFFGWHSSSSVTITLNRVGRLLGSITNQRLPVTVTDEGR